MTTVLVTMTMAFMTISLFEAAISAARKERGLIGVQNTVRHVAFWSGFRVVDHFSSLDVNGPTDSKVVRRCCL